MTLDLKESRKYTNSYYTNWHYLHDLTSLQVKLLQGMEWDGAYIISNSLGLWVVPVARSSIPDVKTTMKYFIRILNEKIKGL